MIIRAWKTNKFTHKLPTTFILRARLQNNGKRVKFELVNNQGKHMGGYWLLELTKNGLHLQKSVGIAVGFELATGEHIRTLIAKGTMNAEEDIPKPTEELTFTDIEQEMTEMSMSIAEGPAIALDIAIMKEPIPIPTVAKPDKATLEKLVEDWNAQDKETEASISQKGAVILKEK